MLPTSPERVAGYKSSEEGTSPTRKTAIDPGKVSSPTRKLPRLQAVVRRIGSTFSGKTTAPPKSERGEKDFLKAFLKKFDADEVEVLRKVYKELSARNPGSGIDKATFLQYFPLPGLWGERLFQRFDYKCLGAVDYEEFLVGVAVCCRGTKCERIHVLFQVFDLNGDGVLQKDELVTMLSNLPNLDRYVRQTDQFQSSNEAPKPASHSPIPSRCESLIQPSQAGEEGLAERLDSLNFPEDTHFNEKFACLTNNFEDDADPYDSEPSSGDEASFVEDDDSAAAKMAECGESEHLGELVEKGELEGEEELESDSSTGTGGVDNTSPKGGSVTAGGGTEVRHGVLPDGEGSEIPQSSVSADVVVNNIDVEAFVDKIIEECEYSESDSLTFIEFKTWLEKNDNILAMFSDCLHEDAWGLQGNALYRHTTNLSKEPGGEGKAAHRRFNSFVRDVRSRERSKRVDIRPDSFYKIKRLFTDPTATTSSLLNYSDIKQQQQQQQLYHNVGARSGFVKNGTSLESLSPTSMSEDANIHQTKDLASGHENMEIYPRQTRDILALQLMDLIAASNPDVDLAQIQSPNEPANIGEPLRCPSCGSLLVVCPRCHRRFPTLRLSNGVVVAECRCCLEGKVHQFRNCWYCNWNFAQAVDHVDHCEPLCEGPLYKIGRHMHKWRKRYFVLVDNLLYYYNSKEDTKPRGFIFLEGCFVEIMKGPGRDQPVGEALLAPFTPPIMKLSVTASTTTGKFGFSIIHGGSKIPRRDLYARTEKERQLWVDSLRSAMNQQDIESVYQIGEVVGQGKFSVVHRAISRDTNESVAIKIIDKSKIDGHEAELLRSEIAILRLLRHPHVINFREILDTRTTIHIVMEYVAGGELYDLLQQKRRLPELHVNRIVFQLLSTVAYLHKCGIIHRDLKPENILLTSNTINADIKITDFGLSCICGPDELVTQPCGTLAYVAPEVLTLQGYHHKVDVWSVGVIMYLLLRGRLPFPVGRPAVQTGAHYYRPLTFEGAIWSNVCSSAKDLLKKLLQPLPEKRISAQDALQHIWIKNPTAVISEGATIEELYEPSRYLSDHIEENESSSSRRPSATTAATASAPPPILQPELIDVSAATFSMTAPTRTTTPPSSHQNVSHIDGAQIPLQAPH